MPSAPIPNVAFANLRGRGFADSTQAWGLDLPSFSNGSAYGDLDGDGDLDLVVNVANGPPLLYKNNSGTFTPSNLGYTFELLDTISTANRLAIGSRVEVYTAGQSQVAEANFTKGFLSNVEPVLHFGTGSSRIDSLRVSWSSGGVETFTDFDTRRHVLLQRTVSATPQAARPIAAGNDKGWEPLAWRHRESVHDDTDRYPFLPEMHSAEGPALAVSAASGRGARSVFIGAAAGRSSIIATISQSGAWTAVDSSAFVESSKAEHVDAVWGDIDADGDEDLVVGSGGDEAIFGLTERTLQVFRRGPTGKLYDDPSATSSFTNGLSCGALLLEDLDGDGDLDIFFGTHYAIGAFGQSAPSIVLLNNGKGVFSPSPPTQSLLGLDRVKAALMTDLDGDGKRELVVAQEFGPVTAYQWRESGLVQVAVGPRGLWQALLAVPLAGGGSELIAGNHGLNSRLRASPTSPLNWWLVDLDNNGTPEQFLSMGPAGEDVPLVQLQEIAAKVPSIRKRYSRFKAFAKTTTLDLLGEARPRRHLWADELRTGSLRWVLGTDSLRFVALPTETQRTQIRALALGNGADRVVYCAGNYTYVKPEFGGQYSGRGAALRRDANGEWKFISAGFPYLRGEVRGLALAQGMLIAALNDEAPLMYSLNTDL